MGSLEFSVWFGVPRGGGKRVQVVKRVGVMMVSLVCSCMLGGEVEGMELTGQRLGGKYYLKRLGLVVG